MDSKERQRLQNINQIKNLYTGQKRIPLAGIPGGGQVLGLQKPLPSISQAIQQSEKKPLREGLKPMTPSLIHASVENQERPIEIKCREPMMGLQDSSLASLLDNPNPVKTTIDENQKQMASRAPKSELTFQSLSSHQNNQQLLSSQMNQHQVNSKGADLNRQAHFGFEPTTSEIEENRPSFAKNMQQNYGDQNFEEDDYKGTQPDQLKNNFTECHIMQQGLKPINEAAGINNMSPQQMMVNQQPMYYAGNQDPAARRMRQFDHYAIRQSQESMGGYSGSFALSVSPSCGHTSTNPMYSEFVRLDEDEDNWLKCQMMPKTGSNQKQFHGVHDQPNQLGPLYRQMQQIGDFYKHPPLYQTPGDQQSIDQINLTMDEHLKDESIYQEEGEDHTNQAFKQPFGLQDDKNSPSRDIENEVSQTPANTQSRQDKDMSQPNDEPMQSYAANHDGPPDKEAASNDSAPALNQDTFAQFKERYQIQIERAKREKQKQAERNRQLLKNKPIDLQRQTEMQEPAIPDSKTSQGDKEEIKIKPFNIDEPAEFQKSSSESYIKNRFENDDEYLSHHISIAQSKKFDEDQLLRRSDRSEVHEAPMQIDDSDQLEEDSHRNQSEKHLPHIEEFDDDENQTMQDLSQVHLINEEDKPLSEIDEDRNLDQLSQISIEKHSDKVKPNVITKPRSKQRRRATTSKGKQLHKEKAVVKEIGDCDDEDKRDDDVDKESNVSMEDSQQQADVNNWQQLCNEQEEKWTKDQDKRLRMLMNLHKADNIDKVAEEINNYIEEIKAMECSSVDNDKQFDPRMAKKTPEECAERWLVLRNICEDGQVKFVRGHWVPEEDLVLRRRVDEFGVKKWKEIASFLPGRVGKQCRERWFNNVDPKLNKDKWTVDEDIQLIELHKQYGNKWAQIQKYMPGRIDNDIKNRFNSNLKKFKSFEEYLDSIDKNDDKDNYKHLIRNREFKKDPTPRRAAPRHVNMVKKEEGRTANLRSRDARRRRDLSSNCATRGNKSPDGHRNSRNSTISMHSSADKRDGELRTDQKADKPSGFKQKQDCNGNFYQRPFNSLFCKLNRNFEGREDSQLQDEEEKLLVENLLIFDLPKILTDDKLMFRKIFRIVQLSQEEILRKRHQEKRFKINAFESYTTVPPESQGPKVLYMTPKVQNNENSQDDIMRDIEGHPIEKIVTSKLSEKQLQEKWKQEEEELEKVRKAREILKAAKQEGATDDELLSKAKELSKEMMKPSEISAMNLSEKSDSFTVKSHIKSEYNQKQSGYSFAQIVKTQQTTLIKKESPQFKSQSMDKFQINSNEAIGVKMPVHIRNNPQREMLATLQRISGITCPSTNSTYQKIFQTKTVSRHHGKDDKGICSTQLAVIKASDSPYPRSNSLNHFSQQTFPFNRGQTDAQKAHKVQISKQGNTASIVEIHEFDNKPRERVIQSARKSPNDFGSILQKNTSGLNKHKTPVNKPQPATIKTPEQVKDPKKDSRAKPAAHPIKGQTIQLKPSKVEEKPNACTRSKPISKPDEKVTTSSTVQKKFMPKRSNPIPPPRDRKKVPPSLHTSSKQKAPITKSSKQSASKCGFSVNKNERSIRDSRSTSNHVPPTRNSIRIMARQLDNDKTETSKQQETEKPSDSDKVKVTKNNKLDRRFKCNKKIEERQDKSSSGSTNKRSKGNSSSSVSKDKGKSHSQPETVSNLDLDKLSDQKYRLDILKQLQDGIDELKKLKQLKKDKPSSQTNQSKKDSVNGMMTRQSIRLRERGDDSSRGKHIDINKLINKKGAKLDTKGRAASYGLNEKEVRDQSIMEQYERIQQEQNQIMNCNKIDYNIFIAKELRINENVSPILHSLCKTNVQVTNQNKNFTFQRKNGEIGLVSATPIKPTKIGGQSEAPNCSNKKQKLTDSEEKQIIQTIQSPKPAQSHSKEQAQSKHLTAKPQDPTKTTKVLPTSSIGKESKTKANLKESLKQPLSKQVIHNQRHESSKKDHSISQMGLKPTPIDIDRDGDLQIPNNQGTELAYMYSQSQYQHIPYDLHFNQQSQMSMQGYPPMKNIYDGGAAYPMGPPQMAQPANMMMMNQIHQMMPQANPYMQQGYPGQQPMQFYSAPQGMMHHQFQQPQFAAPSQMPQRFYPHPYMGGLQAHQQSHSPYRSQFVPPHFPLSMMNKRTDTMTPQRNAANKNTKSTNKLEPDDQKQRHAKQTQNQQQMHSEVPYSGSHVTGNFMMGPPDMDQHMTHQNLNNLANNSTNLLNQVGQQFINLDPIMGKPNGIKLGGDLHFRKRELKMQDKHHQQLKHHVGQAAGGKDTVKMTNKD